MQSVHVFCKCVTLPEPQWLTRVEAPRIQRSGIFNREVIMQSWLIKSLALGHSFHLHLFSSLLSLGVGVKVPSLYQGLAFGDWLPS